MNTPFSLGQLTVSFKGSLDIRYDPQASAELGTDYWRVVAPFKVYLKADLSAWVDIPPGYLTDGASVPRLLQGIYPAWSWYGPGVVPHDILCEYLSITVAGQPQVITRADADAILLAILLELAKQAPSISDYESTARTLYAAVRAYAEVLGIKKPSTTAKKRALEALWINPPSGNGQRKGAVSA